MVIGSAGVFRFKSRFRSCEEGALIQKGKGNPDINDGCGSTKVSMDRKTFVLSSSEGNFPPYRNFFRPFSYSHARPKFSHHAETFSIIFPFPCRIVCTTFFSFCITCFIAVYISLCIFYICIFFLFDCVRKNSLNSEKCAWRLTKRVFKMCFLV